jgi:hypothetical protein
MIGKGPATCPPFLLGASRLRSRRERFESKVGSGIERAALGEEQHGGEGPWRICCCEQGVAMCVDRPQWRFW